MKRLIGIIIITILLIGGGIVEEIYIRKTITRLETYAINLEEKIMANKDNINTKEINSSFDELNNFWTETETAFCYLTNFEKFRSLDESVVKLNSAIFYNDFSVATENLTLIKNYAKVLYYTLGTSLNNII